MIVAGLDTPFQLKGDSSFQNTMEFMAVVLGLGLLAKEGIHNARFRLRGDSRTSLAWAKKHRFKPGPSEATASAFLLFNQVCGLCMGEEDNEFILGLINVECDGLSRGKNPAQLGYDPSIIRSILPGDTLYQLVCLCDPLTRLTDEMAISKLHHQMEGLLLRL